MRTRLLPAALVLASVGAPALAQTPYPAETNLRFEVWDGSAWTNTVNANPGDRIEWRAVVSYVGTRTDVMGLAEILYQPVIPNADNEGPVRDELGPWRNGGVSGNFIPGTLLSPAEGQDGGPLPSYGRIGFGFFSTEATGSNVLTSFRHSGGSDGAPQGDWLRIAGNFVSQWPSSGTGAWTTDDSNRILRGVSAGQWCRINPLTGVPNPVWQGGTQDLVIFRQALIVGDAAQDRTIEITMQDEFLRRAGMGVGSTDNRRHVRWFTQDVQQHSAAYRTSLTITPAIALVTIPSPGLGVAAIAGCAAVVRRRRGTSMVRHGGAHSM